MLKKIVKFSQRFYLLNNLRLKLYKIAYKKQISNFDVPIIIFSNARGGSTLLSNILVSSAKCEEIFEPLNYKRFRYHGAPFEARYEDIYMNPKRDEIILKYIENLLVGNIVMSFKKSKSSSRFVLKFINGKDSISFLKSRLDAVFIYFIRDPISTCLSRYNWGWRDYNKRCFYLYSNHKDSFTDVQKKWIDQMKLETGDLLDLVIGWCIENFVGLKQATESDILVLTYEELIENPEDVIAKLNSNVGGNLNIDSSLFLSRLLKPSESESAYSDKVKSDRTGLLSWQTYGEKHKVLDVLEAFELRDYLRIP